MSDKKFYRTTITLVVLSEFPYEPTTLDGIEYDITEGHCSGAWQVTESKELTPPEAAQELLEQGSDPEFFNLDLQGNLLDEEEA